MKINAFKLDLIFDKFCSLDTHYSINAFFIYYLIKTQTSDFQFIIIKRDSDLISGFF